MFNSAESGSYPWLIRWRSSPMARVCSACASSQMFYMTWAVKPAPPRLSVRYMYSGECDSMGSCKDALSHLRDEEPFGYCKYCALRLRQHQNAVLVCVCLCCTLCAGSLDLTLPWPSSLSEMRGLAGALWQRSVTYHVLTNNRNVCNSQCVSSSF